VTSSSQPLAGLDLALVGPGRVGSSLTHWAVARGARCLSVSGRAGSTRARELAARLGARTADSSEIADPEARLVLLAVPDAALGEVARRLAGHRRSAVALHLAGSWGASVLAPLAAAGWRTGSFHPLRAFAAVEPDPAAAAGTFFALDGDAEARALGRRLAAAFEAEAAVVPEEQRVLYHWAATVAAGGVAALLATADAVGRRLGLPGSALRGYARLAAGALEAAAGADPPALAITGPVARGDLESVDRQLAALRESAPDLLPLALVLARAILARRTEAGLGEPAGSPLAERLAKSDLLDRSKDPVLTSPRPGSA